MASDVQNETEDLTGSMWRDDLWLQAYPLNAQTALDYFSLSPFYDASCSNEKAKLQGLDVSQMQQLGPGTEFVLQELQEPPLFVVKRQFRSAAATVVTHALYYILEGSIYQAPTLHAAISARLARCATNIRTAFSRMQEDLDPVVVGERQTQQQDEEDRVAAAAAEAAAALRPSKEEQDRNSTVDSIIRAALRQHGSVPAMVMPPGSKSMPTPSC